MSVIKWDSSFAVGVDAMDSQHKNLFAIMDKFYSAAKSNATAGMQSSIFQELLDYTVTHFTMEEKYLQQHDYPDFAVHKSLHERLLQEARQHHANVAAGKPGASKAAIDFLKHWLEDHIRYTDMKYGEYMVKKGVA